VAFILLVIFKQEKVKTGSICGKTMQLDENEEDLKSQQEEQQLQQPASSMEGPNGPGQNSTASFYEMTFKQLC